MDFKIDKGLDLHLEGTVLPELETLETPESCFVKPSDFLWLKPHLLVSEGDTVEIGTPLFCDKKDERIRIVSPVTGRVKAIVRGEKRTIECITIEVQADSSTQKSINIKNTDNSAEIRDLMLQYGLWPCLRQRPFSTIPSPDSQPKAIFIPCFDTAPLAPSYPILMRGLEKHFSAGLHILQQLTDRNIPIHLSFKTDTDILIDKSLQNIHIHHFNGPHPTGNVGPQIHRIAPLDKGESIWYVHPADVSRIGRFFQQHILCFDTIFALTGPAVTAPKHYQTIYGADISNLLKNSIKHTFYHNQNLEQECGEQKNLLKGSYNPDNSEPEKRQTDMRDNIRYINGNILTGKRIKQFHCVGFYEHQLTVLPEGGQRELLGWLLPSFKKWSISHTFTAWLSKRKIFKFNTSQHGDHRNFVMTDLYEKVFPYHYIPPLELLKACMTHDLDRMEELGIYEVDSEDFALCELVCPSKMPCQEIILEGLREVWGEAGD